MKKKSGILAFILCLLCLFCWGCTDFQEFKDDLDESERQEFQEEIDNSKSDMEGVKVLAKPSDYDFAAAVGEGLTENYYNLFAFEILRGLYMIYENPRNVAADYITNYYFPPDKDNSIDI